MLERATSNELWSKAVRIVLAFALAFWGTLHIENVAFAALIIDGSSSHDAGTLSNLAIWEIDKTDGTRISEQVTSVRDTAAEKAQATDVKLSTAGGQMQFVAVPAWNDASARGDTEGASDDEGDVPVADFVQWEVSDSSVATIETSGAIAMLSAKNPGTVTVTCHLGTGRDNLVEGGFAAEHPGKAFEASFTVRVVGPYVSSIELHKADGSACYDNEEIVLSESDGGSYALWAKVNTFDEATGASSSYELAGGQSLASASGGVFSDLSWQVLDAGGAEAPGSEATVSNGAVSLTGDGPITVRCTSAEGLNGIPLVAQVVVSTQKADAGGEDDLQGADDHQDLLTITIDAPVTRESKAKNATDSGEEGSEGPPANGEGASDSATAVDSSAKEGNPEESGDAPERIEVTSTYTLEELQAALEFGTETYRMASSGGLITVEGEGPTLAAVLDLAGVTVDDQPGIESVEFVIAGGKSVSVDWSDLVAVSKPSIMLAARSYVHAETGDTPDEPNDESAVTLLDNTRFRLLYNGSGSGALADSASFRWISGIIVHIKGADTPAEEPKPDEGDDPKVFVDYIPVPKGDTALLSTRYHLPDSIAGGTVYFNYRWEMSVTGSDWTLAQEVADGEGGESAGGIQTLHVKTADGTIGTYRRFVLNITQVDGETGEEIETTVASSPVKIVEAEESDEGYTVALDYVPPIAGDIANFTAKPNVTDTAIDASRIYYEWQMSTDGGMTWVGEDSVDYPDLLKRQSGTMCTTLRMPTAAANKSGEDGTITQITYIRVVAHCNGHKVASNAQPLTVHVGDPSGGKAEDIQNQIDDVQGGQGDGNPSASVEREPQQISEIDNVVYEQPTDTAIPEEAGQQDAAAETPTQIYVNDAISAQVVEQQEAIGEQLDSEAPGKRWVQLSTVNPTPNDVRNVLASNPFAPFVAPAALGLTAAGLVEKLFAFRRQIK